MFTTINFLISIPIRVLDLMLNLSEMGLSTATFYLIFHLTIFIPRISVTVGRLHDVEEVAR